MPTTSDLFRMMALQNALVNAGGLFSALGTRSLDPAGPSQAMGNFFNQAGVRGQNMLESMLRANEMQARREQEEKRIGLQERQVATGEKAEDRLGRRLEMDEAERQAAVKRAADIVLQAQNPELARMDPDAYAKRAIEVGLRPEPTPTAMQRNLESAGIMPGTSQYSDIVQQRYTKPLVSIGKPLMREQPPTGEGRPTTGYAGSGMTYEELAAQSSGFWEQVGQTIDNVAGGVFGAPPQWPQTAEAKRQLGLINKAIEIGLVESDKFPVKEREQVQRLLPSPDAWFRGDEQAMRDASALRTYLTELRDQYTWERDRAPNITQDRRDRAANKVVDLDRLLAMMGGSSRTQGLRNDLREMSDEELLRELGIQ